MTAWDTIGMVAYIESQCDPGYLASFYGPTQQLYNDDIVTKMGICSVYFVRQHESE